MSQESKHFEWHLNILPFSTHAVILASGRHIVQYLLLILCPCVNFCCLGHFFYFAALSGMGRTSPKNTMFNVTFTSTPKSYIQKGNCLQRGQYRPSWRSRVLWLSLYHPPSLTKHTDICYFNSHIMLRLFHDHLLAGWENLPYLLSLKAARGEQNHKISWGWEKHKWKPEQWKGRHVAVYKEGTSPHFQVVQSFTSFPNSNGNYMLWKS